MKQKSRISERISLLNKRKILHFMLLSKNPVSRADLSRMLGISFPAISKNVGKLIEQGLLIEKSKGTADLGRKPILLDVNPYAGLIVMIHIGYQNAELVFCNLKKEIVDQQKIVFDRSTQFEELNKILFENVKNTSRKYIDRGYEKIISVGIAVPAPVNYKNSELVYSRYYKWKNERLPNSIDILEKEIPVYWENDSNLLAIGSALKYGCSKSLLAVYLGLGIASGIIINGYLHKGFNGEAGEIGQVLIPVNGEFHELERFISEESLIEFARKQLGLDYASNELVLEQLEKRLNNALVRNTFEMIATRVGQFIAIMVKTIDPEKVIFDGSIVRKCPTLIDMVVDKVMKFTNSPQDIFHPVQENESPILDGIYLTAIRKTFGFEKLEPSEL